MCNAASAKDGSHAQKLAPATPPAATTTTNDSVLMDMLLDEAVDELYHDANDGQAGPWQKNSFSMNKMLGEVYDDEEAGDLTAFGGSAGLRDTFQLKREKQKPGYTARDSFQLHKNSAGILRDSFTNRPLSSAQSAEPTASPQMVFQEAATKAQLFGSLDEANGISSSATASSMASAKQAGMSTVAQANAKSKAQHVRNPSTIAQLLQQTPSRLFGDALCENIVLDAMLHDESRLMRNIVRSRCGLGRMSDTHVSRSRRSWERGVGVTTPVVLPRRSEKFAEFLCERFRHHLRVALAEGKCDYLELRIAMEDGYLREIASDEAEKHCEEEAEPEAEYRLSRASRVQERREKQHRLLPEEKEAITAMLSMSRKNKKLYNDYDLYDVAYVCKVQRTAQLCGEGVGYGRRWGRDPAADAAVAQDRKSKKSSIFRFFSSKSSSSLSPQARKEHQQDTVARASQQQEEQQQHEQQQHPPKLHKHVRIDTPRNVEFINPRKPKFGGWRNQP